MHRIVPHSLTIEQKDQRGTAYDDFFQTCQTNPRCLNYVVNGGESCVVQQNHETELHGVEKVCFKIHI
jgi:hypothetical protein